MKKISEHPQKSIGFLENQKSAKQISQFVRKQNFQTRGQVSIEFVITVGFALLMIIPLIILMYEHTSKTYEGVNNNQAGLIARKITDSANSVYYLGYPTTITLKVYMPEDIESINISGREIAFKSDSGQEAVSVANVNLTGAISLGSGIKYIKVSALANMVNISEDVS